MVRCRRVPTCRDVDMIRFDRRRKHDEYRRLVEAKDAGRREGERRKRERDQEQELREAHERDRLTQLQHWGAPSDSGPDHIPTPESPYPTYVFHPSVLLALWPGRI